MKLVKVEKIAKSEEMIYNRNNKIYKYLFMVLNSYRICAILYIWILCKKTYLKYQGEIGALERCVENTIRGLMWGNAYEREKAKLF